MDDQIQNLLTLHANAISTRTIDSTTKRKIIPAGTGFAFPIRHSRRFRIVDLHGEQVVDLMAWVGPLKPHQSITEAEHFSASYTRYRMGSLATPQVGECLYSNADRAMFQLTEDTVKTHDLLFMACNPSFYSRQPSSSSHVDDIDHRQDKTADHPSCATNISTAMRLHGMTHWTQVHDPFNVFQNTPYYTLKGRLNASRAGDHVELECLLDHCIVALSCCPFTGQGFNGGKITDVAVVWEE